MLHVQRQRSRPRTWARHNGTPESRYGLAFRPPASASAVRTGVRNVAIFLAVAILCLAGLTLGQPLSLATSRQPEPFSELYFVTPRPGTAVVGADGRLVLSFAIHNLGDSVASYPFSISADGRVLDQGTLPGVQVSDTGTVTRQLVLPPGQAAVRLKVALGGGQSIQMWVNRGTA